MLHIVTSTHSPSDCAFRGPDEQERLVGALVAFQDRAAALGLTVQGPWMARTAHDIYMLVDAPDAHTVEQALIEAGLVAISQNRVVPVVEAAALLATLGH